MIRVAWFAAVLLAASHSVTRAGEDSPLAAAAWLAGEWQAEIRNGSVEESWLTPAGGLMTAMSRTVREGRATGFEFITLHVDGDELVYTARPSGQAETEFRGGAETEGHLSFRNPEHDFPQRIDYLRQDDGSIVAKVYGKVDDAEPAFGLHYRPAGGTGGETTDGES